VEEVFLPCRAPMPSFKRVFPTSPFWRKILSYENLSSSPLFFCRLISFFFFFLSFSLCASQYQIEVGGGGFWLNVGRVGLKALGFDVEKLGVPMDVLCNLDFQGNVLAYNSTLHQFVRLFHGFLELLLSFFLSYPTKKKN
jgi:hypothetical protein